MKKIFTLIFAFCFFVANSQNTCTHTFNMYDSYDDGWNGASVDVIVNGVTVVFAATGISPSIPSQLPAPCGSETFVASSGASITLSNWVSGSYDQEISWDIKDDIGTIIASGGTMANGGGYGMLANCNGSCLGVPNSWDCNGNGTCSDPGDGSGQFSSQSGCLSQCLSTPSWDCNANGTCSDPGNGSGQYSTQAACVNACIVIPSWDCDGNNGTCVDPGNGSGQYPTQAACVSSCVLAPSWQCNHTFNMYDSYGDGWNGATCDITVNGVTVVYGATGANVGTAGPCGTENFQAFVGDIIFLTNWTFGSTALNYQISWDIRDGNGTIIAGVGANNGNNVGEFGGPQYASSYLPILGFCSPPASWDCNANGTCSDPGTGLGQYSTQAACVSSCVVTPSWDCDGSNGICSDPGDGSGQYSTQSACISACIVTPSWDCDPTSGTCSDPGDGSGQ